MLTQVVKTIRAESESPSVVGDLSFFIGIPQQNSVQCSDKADATCLILTKQDYEELVVCPLLPHHQHSHAPTCFIAVPLARHPRAPTSPHLRCRCRIAFPFQLSALSTSPGIPVQITV